MRARLATDQEAHDWDRLILETPRPHLLQSTGWARLKSATAWRAERFVLVGWDAVGQLGDAAVLAVLGLVASWAPLVPPAWFGSDS